MTQSNVLTTTTTACFRSSIEIYDNRLFLLATFMIWFFFKKVSFDLKSKNFDKTKKVACFFSFSSNFFANIYTSSSILKAKLACMELTQIVKTQKSKSSKVTYNIPLNVSTFENNFTKKNSGVGFSDIKVIL